LCCRRIARDRSDSRPFVLLYGSPDWERTTFREQLEELAGQINLKVVHVLEKPHEGWKGESRFVTEEMLRRHVPADMLRDCPCFVSGPEAMMDAVEAALLKLGVPTHHLRSERFKIA
jgi:ferredoxin-NADP reductase